MRKVAVYMVLVMLLLAGCTRIEKITNADAEVLRQTAQEINEASTLPMALLTSNAQANPADYEDYIPNYTSFDYYGTDYVLCFCGFPTDEDGYFLTEITWTGESYRLYGVKVGEEKAIAAELMQLQGYTLISEGYMMELEKNGVTVRLTGDTAVEEVRVHIPTKFTSGNLY